MTLDPVQLGLAAVAAAAAGAVNAVAGGGTLLTFPSLVALGIPPVAANATSTVALWPGSLGGIWGYRAVLAGAWPWAWRFALPSVVGGLAGALLLLRTPPGRFAALAPWLVLVATLLFAAQGPVLARLRARRGAGAAGAPPPAAPDGDPRLSPPGLVLQLLTAVYGGYFGAGIGILMLATLGLLGFTQIHRMNGIKNWGALCINAVAATTFAVSGLVHWPVALVMAVAAMLGGAAGARVAQRVAPGAVRGIVIGIGLLSAAWLLVEQLRATGG